jgi:hypothetical protein
MIFSARMTSSGSVQVPPTPKLPPKTDVSATPETAGDAMERLAELHGAMGTVQKSWGKPWKHMEYGNMWNICVLLFFDDERCWKI